MVGVPVKPRTPVVVFAALKLLLTVAAVLEAGMSQDPNVSANADEERAYPAATMTRTDLAES